MYRDFNDGEEKDAAITSNKTAEDEGDYVIEYFEYGFDQLIDTYYPDRQPNQIDSDHDS